MGHITCLISFDRPAGSGVEHKELYPTPFSFINLENPMTQSTTELVRSRNLQFFTRSVPWNFWPFLPVVRRRPGCDQELGVLFDSLNAGGPPGFSNTIFLVNIFCLPAELEELLKLPKEVFDTADEVADSGWSVD